MNARGISDVGRRAITGGDADVEEVRPGRRDLLRLAGAAAAGVVAAGMIGGATAEANDGGPMLIAGTNTSSTTATALVGGPMAVVQSTVGASIVGNNTRANAGIGILGSTPDGVGVKGQSIASAFGSVLGTGVEGQGAVIGTAGYSVNGAGLTGSSTNGIGVDAYSNGQVALRAASMGFIDLVCAGTGRLRLNQHLAVGPPITGSYFIGEMVRDEQGDFFVCVAGNGMGPGSWRKIGGPGTAGSFHPIVPARAYDSRKTMTPMANGLLATGTSRTLTLKDKRDAGTGAVVLANVVPDGASAVAFNLTVASTLGSNGYLGINPGIDPTVYASHVNWFGPGQTHANAGVIGLDSLRRVTVSCGGAAGCATHFIVDVTGYYR